MQKDGHLINVKNEIGLYWREFRERALVEPDLMKELTSDLLKKHATKNKYEYEDSDRVDPELI